jgi:predicted HNH restriction endonuclease
MTSEEEKRLLLLLSMVHLDGGGTKQQVLDAIQEQSWIRLTLGEQRVMDTRNEAIWRNNLAFVRLHLVNDGYVSDRVRNEWRITEKGTKYFHQLCQKAKRTSSLQHMSDQALLKIESLISSPTLLSDENALTGETQFQEGEKKYQWTTRYERDPQLRAKAIEIHGLTCMGCRFSFEQIYGDIGYGFIEVHHTKPVSLFGGVTFVNPQSDMVTLCSNCHSIVHRKKSEPLALQGLTALLNAR